MDFFKKVAHFFGRGIYLQLPWGNEGRGTKLYLWPVTFGGTVLGAAYAGDKAWEYVGPIVDKLL